MKRLIIYYCIALFAFENLFAQTNAVTLSTISNYCQWGWNAIVMKNECITIATMPAIGGRIMQYDLDTLPSLFVNSGELGHTYTPSKNNPWYNFGGYKTWPSPQYRWPNTWPPPPTLDYGTYTSQVDTSSTDSVSVTVTSPIETWIATGIQFQRTATMYKGTSRVKMDQTMTNTGSTTASWGMWSVWQTNVHHTNKTDYSNYWAYFPLNPNSIYGSTGVAKPNGNSNAWQGQVANGVYGVEFVADDKKIFADPAKGWLAYTSISDTVVFARTFNIYEGAHYPDSARTTVYVSATSPTYMEVEVKGPIIDLSPYGGTSTFTENWWAAKVRAPILDVNSVGAIAKHLTYDSVAKHYSAFYGVFYNGIVRTIFYNSSGSKIIEGQSYKVSPHNEVQIRDSVVVPGSAALAQVEVCDTNGTLIGVLDSLNLLRPSTGINSSSQHSPSLCHVFQNYPNPFNPSTTISFNLPSKSFVTLKVFDVMGREIANIISEELLAGNYSRQWNADKIASGVYFYRLQARQTDGGQAGAFTQTKKLLLLK